MKVIDVKKLKHKDSLAHKKRQRVIAGMIVLLLIALAAVAGLGYWFFFTPSFVIKNLTINGVNPDHLSGIQSYLDTVQQRKFLGIPFGKNLIILRSSAMAGDLIKQFAFIDSVKIDKNYFHELAVSVKERKPEGVWCNGPENCRYFDDQGFTWGPAVQSSGFLLLNVTDLRGRTDIDPLMLNAIHTIRPGIDAVGLRIKEITIPKDVFNEIVVSTNRFPLRFSIDSNLKDQMEVLRIFLSQKDKNGDFVAQYLDLRFDGRVYFK